MDQELYKEDTVVYYIEVDQCVVIYYTEPIEIKNEEERNQIIEQAEEKIKSLLDEQYPDWRNPAAYWDVEF